MSSEFKWDKGIDFRETYDRLVADLKKYRGMNGIRAKTRLVYIIILIIALRNGSRISEAIEAAIKWSRTKDREVEVRVRKKKKHETRLMIIPSEISDKDRVWIQWKLNEKGLDRTAISHYARNNYGFNPHSVRYSFITYLSTKGVSETLIAKITKHSKLDFILKYTQQKKAEDILKELP